MSRRSCDACSNLRENASEFIQNGVTETVCNSLHNDTGFNPNLTVLRTNEEDLHDANDCLIGQMVDEIEAYDVCDWKEYMRKLMPNLYELLKAIICALGGLWARQDRACETIDALISIGTEQTAVVRQDWLNPKITAVGDPSIDRQVDSLFTIKSARDCDGKTLRLQLYGFFMQGGYRMDNIQNGDLVAKWNKSTLVPKYIDPKTWEILKVTTHNDNLCTVNNDRLLLGRCHVVNEELHLYVDAIIGASVATGVCETIQPNVRTRYL